MQAVGRTDPGMVRDINQDAIFISTTPVGPLPSLFLVADGMGGHNAGDFASKFLVEHLVEHLEGQSLQTPQIKALQDGIHTVNQMLYEKSLEDIQFHGMGTTLVAAVFCGGKLYVANIGDSRLYVVGKEIRQITKDHSYVEEMVALGLMNRGSADYKRNKNIITRAVGTASEVQIDFFEVSLREGEQFLLCSDGLPNMVEEKSIYKIVKNAPSLEVAVRILVDRANNSGGFDNISVVLVKPRESGVRPC